MTSAWQELAARKGYATEKDMWVDLYKNHSIKDLSTMLACTHYIVRKKLAEFGIGIRPRGGPYGTKLEKFTQEIADRMAAEGPAVVAKSLGISTAALFRRKRQWLEERATSDQTQHEGARSESQDPPAPDHSPSPAQPEGKE